MDNTAIRPAARIFGGKKRGFRGIMAAAAMVLLFAAAGPAISGAAFSWAAAGDSSLQTQSPSTGSGGLNILPESYPKDGYTHMNATSSGFKFFFDGNVTAPNVLANNLKCFTLLDSSGKAIPTEAIAGGKKDNYILVVANPKNSTHMLGNNASYQLIVSGKLSSTDGKTLGEDVTIHFKTVDVSMNTRVYMLIMVIMLGAMVGMSVLQSRRKKRLAAEVAAGVRGDRINPYKYAREKGVSVDEARAYIEKEKHKRAKKLGVTAEELDKKIEEAKRKPTVSGAKRVSGPKPISAAGGQYRTGRKALAEKKKKEAAARRAAAANKNSKNSGSKKKGNKKR